MASSNEEIRNRQEDVLVNVNGDLQPIGSTHISALDRGFLYGDGVFDDLPIYDSKAVLLDRHIDRLYRSLRGARIDCHLTKEELRSRTIETVEESNVSHGSVRIVVTRGVGMGIRNADAIERPTVVIIPRREDPEAVPYARADPTQETARIASTRVPPADVLDGRIKDCNYLTNALAERELVGTDASCAIMLTHEGTVAEGYDSNVMILDDSGVFRTPPLTHALDGITRAVFIEQAREQGYDVVVEDITPAELFMARDVLLLGSDRGITTVTEIDGRHIGDRAVYEETLAVTTAFRDYVLSNEYTEIAT